MTLTTDNKCADVEPAHDENWHLRIYVVGQAPKSLAALINLKAICEKYLPEQFHIEVIDLLNSPEAAELHQIIAVPTTVKMKPPPAARVIGDLRDTEKTCSGLGISTFSDKHSHDKSG